MFCLPEFKATIKFKELAQLKPLVKISDLLDIIKHYYNCNDERSKLLSLLLYLLLLTGERNETIRTLLFDQFVKVKNEYYIQTYA